MQIITGSTNPTKIKACEITFPEYEVKGIATNSKVRAQPLSDEETREGAINRAIASFQSSEVGFGIGLEGGVMNVDGVIYLCNWGALAVSSEEIYTASGARIALPRAFKAQLDDGVELGDIMADYTQKADVRSKEGAVGIFTNDLVDRSEMFAHVVKLLRGQWEYWTKIQK